MPAINETTVDFWKTLASELASQRPNPGRRVRIAQGRKHCGKEGTVIRHIRDAYSDAFRYAEAAAQHVLDMKGRDGFVVQVSPADGGAPFWVKATYVEVLS